MANTKTFRTNILIIIILCVLGVIIYSNTFDNSFHFDDFAFILNNPAITKIAKLNDIFNYWPNRFVGLLSFAFNYQIHQFRVFGYHLINLAIHILTSLLVFWLLGLTFSTPVMRGNKICRYKKVISFFVSAIFLAHPVQTEPVNYIYQRVTVLAAFFYLASLCLYVKAALASEKNSSFNKFYYFASLTAAFMGIFTKENAVTLPLMILLYDFCFLQTKRSLKWKYTLPFFILLPLLILTTPGFIAKPLFFEDVKILLENPSVSPTHYFLTQPRVLITYLRLFLFPVRQNLDYDYAIARNIWEIPVIASLLILIFILIIGIRMFSRYRLMSFGIFWFFLTLLPESSIIPLLDPICEHRLYLPLVGCIIFAVTAVYYLLRDDKLKIAAVILSLTVASYSFLTYNRNRVWKNEISLWSDVVNKSKQKIRPYNERGLAYFDKGDYDKAIIDFTRAVELNRNYADGFYNRGNVYQKQGVYDKAILDYTAAIMINPRYAKAYINRGLVYYLSQAYEKAVFDFKQAIEIAPFETVAYYNLAAAYYDAKQYDLAVKYCDKAIELGYPVDVTFLEVLKKYRK